jgi:hypothetical protein
MIIDLLTVRDYIFRSGKSLPTERKAPHMSFKDFSVAQKTPGKGGATDKSKDATAAAKPAPAQKPATKS